MADRFARSLSSRGRFALALVVGLKVAAPVASHSVAVASQSVVEVSGEVSCSECRISMDTVLVLEGLDGPGLEFVGPYSSVTVDRRGRFLLTGGPLVPYIAVFDSTGTFMQEIGGLGDGPGEYRTIRGVQVGPRFVHVFDMMSGRTLLDADHRFVRRDPLVLAGSVVGFAVTPSETVIFGGDVPTPGSVGHHLHVLHPDGELRSYGWDGSVVRGPTGRRYAVAANDTTAWLVRGRVGRMEQWTLVPEPKLSKVVVRSVDEFERESAPVPSRFPYALNIDARLDARGLWLAWIAPDLAWSERTTDREVAARWQEDAPRRALFDGLLDLIDPRTGQTLAHYRGDLAWRGFARGSDMIVAYEETQAGVPRLHLLRPTLRR